MSNIRVMWSVFITFPEVAGMVEKKAEYACTWARALADKIRNREDIKLAIVSISDSNKVQKFNVNNVLFYFLPNGKKTMKNGGCSVAREAWRTIINDFKPDIIHIHGSESMVPYELIKMQPDIPIYLTLQGILSNYYKDYTAGIDENDIKSNITIRDIVRHSGILGDKEKTKKKSVFEQEMLKGVHYLGGRTTWDKVSALIINSDALYLYAPEMIRQNFYDSTRWNVNKITPHRIFMHQGFKPIKGLHILLDAMSILKKKYPDIQLYMSGMNVMKNSSLKEKIFQTGYVKYLFKKIADHELEECIHFTGILDADQIINELKASHVMVLPSSIENSPNSLCEAQLVGIPCVASYVGGVPEMLRDGTDGFLYTYNEPLMLAEYISRIFESNELAEQFSISSYQWIRKRQGAELVVSQTMSNYRTILEDWETRSRL